MKSSQARRPLSPWLLLISAILIGLSIVAGWRYWLQTASEAARPAPDFTLADLSGKLLTLSELRGRPVMLNFWTSWCVPCREELPAIQAAYEAHRVQGLVVVGVNIGERTEPLMPFVEEMGLTFPIVFDSDSTVTYQYEVHGIPASFFIDSEGFIRSMHQGPIDLSIIDTHLARILR